MLLDGAGEGRTSQEEGVEGGYGGGSAGGVHASDGRHEVDDVQLREGGRGGEGRGGEIENG